MSTPLSALPDLAERIVSYGRSYVPEALSAALEQRYCEYARARHAPTFHHSLGETR